MYEGDPVSLVKGAGVWVPVVAAHKLAATDTETFVVLPCTDNPVEAVPGIWGTGDERGIVCVIGIDEFDTTLEPGTKVAEVHPAAIQTRICQGCGCQDTDAWVKTKDEPKCGTCGSGKVGGASACRQCGADTAYCGVLGYSGCSECRPEKKLRGRVRKGPTAGLLAGAALAFAALSVSIGMTSKVGQSQLSEPGSVPASSAPPF